jgi:putative transposase
MNAPKCTEYDYLNFLVAAQHAYSRLLQRLPPDSEALWTEVSACIDLRKGLLIIDDTPLDKPYAHNMALVTRHWSGKHHEGGQGIKLVSLVWSRS